MFGARGAAVYACLFAAVPSDAATLVATPANLAAMLSRAVGGDTVKLVGTFGEVRLTNRAFTSRVTIDASSAVMNTTMVLDHDRNVAVSGGTFNIAANGQWAKGIAVYEGANVYIDGVTVHGGGTVDQFGVSFSGTHNVQVTNSKFSGLYSAIGLGSLTAGFIAKNTIVGSTSDGIDIADSHNVTAVLNSCTGTNPREGAHPDCIQMWSVAGHALTSDITVTNNNAYGSTQGFTDFDAGLRLTISNNTVTSTYSQAVACYDCVSSTISNNHVSTLPGAAYQARVQIVRGSGNIVSGNVVGSYVEPQHNATLVDDSSIDAMMLTDNGGSPAFDLAVLANPEGPSFADGASVAAVPEPSTWALLIAGFAAVGLARRRAVAAGRIA